MATTTNNTNSNDSVQPSDPVQPYDALGARLRATPQGKGTPARKAEEYLAVGNHCAWVAGVLGLDATAQAALAKQCLLYAQEGDAQGGGQFDIVRGACTVKGVAVATASSRHVLCLGVTVAGDGQATPAAQAAAAAKRLFDLPANVFAFKELGVDGSIHYGIRDFTATKPLDADWPHWGDALAWWCDGQQAMFITAKAPGGPTQETILPNADQNRYWFTASPKSGSAMG